VKKLPGARVAVVALALASVLVLVFAGCGEDVHSIFDLPLPDAAIEAGDIPPPPPFAEAGPGDGGGAFDACGTTCSSDLHQVLDCNGGVIETCPPDKGCGGGACILPCDSAKANKSSLGCDYYAINPDTTYSSGACYAVFVANTWNAAISITADYAGAPLDMAGLARIPSGGGAALTYAPLTGGKLQPGEIAILFLAAFGPPKAFTPACPAGITPGVTSVDAALHATGIGSSFHITTTAPVSAYDIFPYGGGVSAITSASLLLPTTAWDTNYIAVDAYPTSTQENADGYPWIQVAAAENDTHVTISPTKAIVGGVGVAATDAGAPHTYTLQKGQVLQLTQAEELIGSPVQSDKPIGLWGGNRCVDLPLDKTACDAAHQQIPPVRALGHEYAAVRYRNRFDGVEETPPWRIVGAVDGTTLTYEPSAPPGAPTKIDSREVAEFAAAGPFLVRSQDDQHPFYMAGYMTGSSVVAQGGDNRGDPEFVNVIPPEEYLSSYVFFTDPTYPETNLVIVRTKAKDGTFKDVMLDCAGAPLTGWAPVGTSGKLEYTRFDLVRDNFVKQGACDNGRHEIRSDAPLGLTVWGWGSKATTSFNTQFVSYAYPAGASVKPITTVVVPPTPAVPK
jgi:hypothetical protein